MAAAIAPGTPAPVEAAPAAETAAEPASAAANGIDAVLADLTDEELAGPQEPDAPEGEEEATEPIEAEPAEPADPTKGLDDEVIFSDKALTTKEGVLRAKARIGQLRKLTHDKYRELKSYEGRVIKRDEKVKFKIREFVSDKHATRLLANNMQTIAENGLSGDPERMIGALGSLYGMDGFKALELVNSHLIHRGKVPMDPQIQQVIDSLQQKIDKLEGGLSERDTRAKVQHVTSRIEQHKTSIGERITREAAALPHLARLYAENPQNVIDHIVEEIDQAHASGRPVDGRTYFGNLEAQLARHFQPAQAPQGVGGGPAPKQPATAQRSPGQSIGPRSTAASTPRVPSADEALRALADDEALMSSLGLG